VQLHRTGLTHKLANFGRTFPVSVGHDKVAWCCELAYNYLRSRCLFVLSVRQGMAKDKSAGDV
jgi:hypothetical protein